MLFDFCHEFSFNRICYIFAIHIYNLLNSIKSIVFLMTEFGVKNLLLVIEYIPIVLMYYFTYINIRIYISFAYFISDLILFLFLKIF